MFNGGVGFNQSEHPGVPSETIERRINALDGCIRNMAFTSCDNVTSFPITPVVLAGVAGISKVNLPD